MTEFKFEKPKILKEAEEYFKDKDVTDFINMSPYEEKLFITSLNKFEMLREARWKWLAENKEDIDFILLDTIDTGIAWENRALFISGSEVVYEEYFGLGDRRDVKRFKNKLKRFGIPIDLVSDKTLH